MTSRDVAVILLETLTQAFAGVIENRLRQLAKGSALDIPCA